MMSVDPVGDLKFWYTTEYTTGGWNWRTRIGSFIWTPPPTSPPTANFTSNTTSAYPGEDIFFFDLSTHFPTSWSWSFPGGTPSTSTAKNPSVSYASPGTYDVTLIATNVAGSDTEVKTAYITITPPPPPIADFNSDITLVNPGGSVQFLDNSSNLPTSWSWTL